MGFGASYIRDFTVIVIYFLSRSSYWDIEEDEPSAGQEDSQSTDFQTRFSSTSDSRHEEDRDAARSAETAWRISQADKVGIVASDIDGLAQDYGNSRVSGMELLQTFTKA